MNFEKTDELLGKGGFSSVYICKKRGLDSKNLYAMKIASESGNSSKNHLIIEYKILRLLFGGIGIPKVHFYGVENNRIILVEQLLGNNLSQELKKYKNKFPKKMFINIALQMISRIEFLHTYGFIHCDIKPDNFALSSMKEKEKGDFTVYLIDYGLAEPYINLKTKVHRKLKEGKGNKGTLDFCSINSHMGLSLSRRDDLESLIYCLLYLYYGKLPWTLKNSNNEDVMNKKIEIISIGVDIKNKIFCKMLDYITKLKFEEKPDYKHLKELIKTI